LKTLPHKKGERPKLSPETHYQNSIWLRKFAATFSNSAVSDLTKDHLDMYMDGQAEVGPKTRNEKRSVVKMFLTWAAKKDYLPPTHRLFEAVAFEHETVTLGKVECYTADELRAMLERASRRPEPPNEGEEPEANYRDLLPVIALAGLAGLRFKEITRMEFKEVFRRPDCIEVTAEEAKTRSRRLIDVCTSLAAWLEAYRNRTGPVWPKGYDMLHEDFAALRESLEIPKRRNGLRHSFITAHYAAHSNEGLTARQAGNSPAMVHQHYNGLWTKAEGEAWFAVAPEQAANVIALPAVSRKDAK
jgi:integrase